MANYKAGFKRKLFKKMTSVRPALMCAAVVTGGTLIGFLLGNLGGAEGKAMLAAADAPAGLTAAATGSTPVAPVVFKDEIPSWAGQAITNLNNAGIIKGYEDGRYGPADTLTRAQTVTVIHRMLKYKGILSDPPSAGCGVYSDVPSTHFAFLPACSFKMNAETTGLKETGLEGLIFSPDRKVTRGEAARMIDAMMGNTFLEAMKESRETRQIFSDVKLDSPFASAVALVHLTGIMKGNPDGTFAPDKELNRAEMAMIMDRALNQLEAYKIEQLAAKLDTDKYLTQCAALINQEKEVCKGYDNWMLDIQLAKKVSPSTTFLTVVDKFTIPAGNGCDSDKAGELFPATFRVSTLDKMTSGGGEYSEVICRVGCVHWTCPQDAPQQQCTGGAMKPSECLLNCDGTCTDSPTQVNCSVCVPKSQPPVQPTQEPGKQCVMPQYPNCRGQCAGLPSYPTFEFEDCLTACDNKYNDDLNAYWECEGSY